MNKVFDYNGTFVSASKPVKQLRTIKKTLVVDSADRDTLKYHTNGDFVVYLPRVYENIVSIRLMAAEFPLLIASTSAGAQRRFYSAGQNVSGSYAPSPISLVDNVFYFLIDIEGLNKTDECAVAANRSTFNDGFFAKIPATQTNSGTFIEYNDHSAQDNVARYTPPIGKLDRLHIRTRLHSQQGNLGFIYWTSDGAVPGTTTDNQKSAEFSLSFEIEYLDNVFDDFSSLETRISDRSS